MSPAPIFEFCASTTSKLPLPLWRSSKRRLGFHSIDTKADFDSSSTDNVAETMRWLVCSDGLHGMITQAQLLEAMSTEDLEEAADKLLQAALLSGGKDNITLILLQDDTDIPEKTEETEETGSDEAPAGGEKPEEVTEA